MERKRFHNGKTGKNFQLTIKKQLQLPLKAVKEGIIFIWVEKEYISDVLQFFEDQNIKYVENLVWARLTNLKNSIIKLFILREIKQFKRLL